MQWTGKGDGYTWTDAENWEPMKVPGPGDVATIVGPAMVTAAAVEVKGLELTLDVGLNTTTVDVSQSLIVDCMRIDMGVGGEVRLGAAAQASWSGGWIERLSIPAGAVVTVTDGTEVTTHRTVVDGTLVLAGNQLNMCDDSLTGVGILNNATIDVTAASTVAGTATLDNHGLIRLGGTAAVLRLDYPGGVTGPILVLQPGSTLALNGGMLELAFTQECRFVPGCIITGPGVIAMLSNGALRVDGEAALPPDVTVRVSGGLLGGNVSLGRALVVMTGGEVTDRLTIPLNGTLHLEGDDSKLIKGLNIRGSATIGGGEVWLGRLANAGVVTVAQPVKLTGSGPVVNTGTLSLGPGIPLSLTIDLASNGTLNLGTGEILSEGTVTLSGTVKTEVVLPKVSGQVRIGHIKATGLVTLAGTLQVTGTSPRRLFALPLVTANQVTGAFASVPTGWRVDQSENAALLRSSAGPRFAAHGRLADMRLDGNLQARLDATLTRLGSPFRDVPVALVDLQGFPAAYAQSRGAREVAVASIAKLAALLAAYQLRSDLRTFSTGVPAGPPSSLFDRARKAWGCRSGQAPRFGQIFRATYDHPAPGWNIEFRTTFTTPQELDDIETPLNGQPPWPTAALADLARLGFEEWLKLMTAWSNNAGATACIRQIGYDYLAAVVQDLGLYDATSHGGLWLASEYGDVGPAFGPALGRVGDQLAGVSQGGTAIRLARLMAAIALDEVPVAGAGEAQDAQASAAMRGLLDRTPGALWDYTGSFFADGLRAGGLAPTEVLSKIGMLNDTVGEAAVIGYPTGRRYAAVALSTSVDRLHTLAVALDHCVT